MMRQIPVGTDHDRTGCQLAKRNSGEESTQAHRASPGPHSRRLWRLGVRLLVSVIAGSLLLSVFVAVAPAPSFAQVTVGISVTIPPPALPVYVQPPCPGPDYIWIPGYWAWDPEFGYYWVPGTWVLAPSPGLLWTPGYWSWYDGAYIWHEGYWGPVVGFYGGINYGCGYNGYGYYGGYWKHGRFYYNRRVNHLAGNIPYVYSRSLPKAATASRVSFNGGRGGTALRPNSRQLAAERERRFAPGATQTEHRRAARNDPRLRAEENRGRPAVAATPKPGEFNAPGVRRATRAGAPYQAPAAQPGRAAPPAAREERRPAAGAPGRGRPAAPERQHPAAPEQVRPAAPAHERPAAPPRPAARPPAASRGEFEHPARQMEPQREHVAPSAPRPQTAPHFQREAPHSAPPAPAPHAAPQHQNAAPHPQGGGGRQEEGGPHR